MYNILICDDEQDIRSALKIYLTDKDYNLFEACNGKEALNVIEENNIHLVLMDIMMPLMDGITAMVKLREISNAPVILLTAKSEDSDKILGLNVGADDYITKPFNPMEVIARVKSQLRRYMTLGSAIKSESTLSVNGIEIDDDEKKVRVAGEEVSLTPKEYAILKLLMSKPDTVFSLKDIYESVWKDNSIGAETTVSVHIRHLREKIEINPGEPRYIKVVWGQGYKFERGR